MIMNVYFRLLVFCILLFISKIGYSQDALILQKIKNESRYKVLSLLYDYEIRSFDKTYYSKIYGFSDSSLTITRWVPSENFSSITYPPYAYKTKSDTTIIKPIYVKDTIDILFQDIEYIRRPLLLFPQFLVIPWSTGIFFTLGIPVAAIRNLVVEDKTDIKAFAFVAGASAAIVYLGTRKIKYDTKDKWSLKAIHDEKYKLKSSYDSIWDFNTFLVSISSGVYVPIGRFSDYYSTGFQVGFGLGFRLTHNTRAEFGGFPIFMDKKTIGVMYNNSYHETKSYPVGSFGGWIYNDIYKNKSIFIELATGLSLEVIATNIENPNHDPNSEYEKTLDITTVGFSLGLNTWVHRKIGFKVLYNYAAYDWAKTLKNDLSGQSISISLVYGILN